MSALYPARRPRRRAVFSALLALGAAGAFGLLAPSEAGAGPTPSATGALPDERRPRFYRAELPGAEPEDAPERIVSLAPVLTETLFAVGAGPRVVGVTRYCDRPAAAAELPKIGGYIDPQLERVLALRPDLVVAMPSRGQRHVLDRLRERGVPVLVGFGDTIPEVRALITAVGGAVGAPERARAVLGELDEELAGVGPADGSSRVLIAVGARPLVAAGPGTFADEALRLAGGRRAVAEDGPAWPVLSAEAVAGQRPDLIVAAEGDQARAALERELAGLGPHRPPVVSAGRPILMRPGPHLAADVEALADLLRTHAAPTMPGKAPSDKSSHPRSAEAKAR